MAVGSFSTDFVPVPGARLSAVAAGLKSSGDTDLVLLEFAPGSQTAGVFTQSHFAAAPVQVCRQHLSRAQPRSLLINSGNANAATGDDGLADALACCDALAEQTGVKVEEVLPFSTGVIGERLPTQRIIEALPKLVAGLGEDNWLDAASGIMTTDTCPKIASRQFEWQGTPVTITGIAKGAGMIQPNMATMLAYVVTDVQADQPSLHAALAAAVEKSFNRITVDSDTSTNDCCMLTATGASGVALKDVSEPFKNCLADLMRYLAQSIVRDAEGATKFVTVQVCGGKDEPACLEVAYAVANSPLVKTAIFASDANWGRIVMAIGKSPAALDPSRVDLYLGDICLMQGGAKAPSYTEEKGAAEMARDEITIIVDLNMGDASEIVWTSDLSHDYVSVNADYRS